MWQAFGLFSVFPCRIISREWAMKRFQVGDGAPR